MLGMKHGKRARIYEFKFSMVLPTDSKDSQSFDGVEEMTIAK